MWVVPIVLGPLLVVGSEVKDKDSDDGQDGECKVHPPSPNSKNVPEVGEYSSSDAGRRVTQPRGFFPSGP